MTDDLEAAITDLIRRGGRPRRRRRGDRAGLPEVADRALRLRRGPGDRGRRAGGGRGQPVRPARRRSRTSRCGWTRRSRSSSGSGWRSCGPSGTASAVARALDSLRAAAAGTDNVLPPMKRALAERATVGEVCHALRDVWGTVRAVRAFLRSPRARGGPARLRSGRDIPGTSSLVSHPRPPGSPRRGRSGGPAPARCANERPGRGLRLAIRERDRTGRRSWRRTRRK